MRGARVSRPPPPPFATLRPMEPLDTLYRWSDRMRDRARTGTFLRFLWRRFLDDRLFESAGALSFTMVFALVPLSMVVFGVLSMRSEEHTSELQSLMRISYAVFCLKKKHTRLKHNT